MGKLRLVRPTTSPSHAFGVAGLSSVSGRLPEHAGWHVRQGQALSPKRRGKFTNTNSKSTGHCTAASPFWIGATDAVQDTGPKELVNSCKFRDVYTSRDHARSLVFLLIFCVICLLAFGGSAFASIRAVASLAEIKDCVWEGRETPSVLQPEICPMRAVKKIAIFQAPIYHDQFFGDRHIRNFIGGQWSAKPNGFSYQSIGPNRCRENGFERWCGQAIYFCRFLDGNLSPTHILKSGRLARIFECQNYARLSCVRWFWSRQREAFKQSGIFWENISTQLSSGGLFLTQGGPNQTKSNDSQQNSGYSRKAIPVPVKPESKAIIPKVSPLERARDNVKTFLVLSGILILVGAYACLKLV